MNILFFYVFFCFQNQLFIFFTTYQKYSSFKELGEINGCHLCCMLLDFQRFCCCCRCDFHTKALKRLLNYVLMCSSLNQLPLDLPLSIQTTHSTAPLHCEQIAFGAANEPQWSRPGGVHWWCWWFWYLYIYQ